jgi:hypothetical protein
MQAAWIIVAAFCGLCLGYVITALVAAPQIRDRDRRIANLRAQLEQASKNDNRDTHGRYTAS